MDFDASHMVEVGRDLSYITIKPMTCALKFASIRF